MAMETEEVAEARAALNKAVQAFVEAKNRNMELYPDQGEPYPDIYVTGWSGFIAYTTSELEQSDMFAGIPMVPDGQDPATTVGQLTYGLRRFGA